MESTLATGPSAQELKSPFNDSFRTFFYFFFVIISTIGFTGIGIIFLYNLFKCFKRQWILRQRRDRAIRIRREAIEMGRVLRARADLEVPVG